MGAKGHTTEQIVSILRQVEVEMAGGKKLDEACKTAGVSVNTYYKWKKNYGGLNVSEAKHLRELETENARLKKVVAEQAIDIDILREFKKKLERE
ncbi:MAG TPA: transposase [Candidatus Goldiibacteriota bacterium]|nr:transposase [Candidatus Goldiibacteriota bacterium]